jgi:ribosomal protein S18 acetylase RimI-like enzyme
MTGDDVAPAQEVWAEAFATMRAAYGLPAEAGAGSAERTRERIGHLLATDPGGSWVAEGEDGTVVGLAQALVRDDLWVLSLLGVATARQDRGTGKALLDAAVGYGRDVANGLILCSRDPRAARRYLRAGFRLNPSVTAWGKVDRRRLPAVPGVRPGTPGDLDAVADLDRRARHGAHGPDLDHLLTEGCRLWVLDGRGYTLARGGKPVFLAAEDEQAARDLLYACLAQAGPDDDVEVNWITAPQQWALEVALDVGLDLHPVGPVMTRGMPVPCLYLPSGAYG